ncbi:MAG: calcium/sodium antiporter [Bacteroidales bacterium]|nr:calcium/sodium antiporter [Bacteroidales bacterium]MCM1414895.1 calcium/sodium antiporter [bacterium]MCM1423936.1 calcium/sodium antiporter [bacterium]
MEVIIQIVLLALGFAILVKGADWFVEGASRLAERFGIPQLVIGLTIVALGTSLPEAAVSISAALKGSAGITVGNVLGSNIMNVLLILGLTAVITPIAVQRSTVRYEIPYVILVSAILWALGGTGEHMLRLSDGLILWGLMFLYLAYLFGMAKKGAPLSEETPAKAEKPMPVWRMLLLIVLGGAMIVLGSDVAVDAATELARIFGMSERLIGLTIVAFGTSLPELVTSVTAAVKGKADIAVGNIVGSNIFNILFVVGTSALITPVEYAADFFTDSAVCIASVALLWLCVFRKKRLGRLGGAVMLAGYGAYFIYLIR